MIGDAARARGLQAEYRKLVAFRDAGYGREQTETRIARVLTELWVVEARLQAEGLYLTPDGELVAIPNEMETMA